jgi:DNA-directed RNA polymerase subunit RPC12/RpoP
MDLNVCLACGQWSDDFAVVDDEEAVLVCPACGHRRRFARLPSNRIEGHFAALRYFTLDGTDHPSHQAQNSMIRRYIAWQNRNARDERLREIVNRANVA